MITINTTTSLARDDQDQLQASKIIRLEMSPDDAAQLVTVLFNEHGDPAWTPIWQKVAHLVLAEVNACRATTE